MVTSKSYRKLTNVFLVSSISPRRNPKEDISQLFYFAYCLRYNRLFDKHKMAFEQSLLNGVQIKSRIAIAI